MRADDEPTDDAPAARGTSVGAFSATSALFGGPLVASIMRIEAGGRA